MSLTWSTAFSAPPFAEWLKGAEKVCLMKSPSKYSLNAPEVNAVPSLVRTTVGNPVIDHHLSNTLMAFAAVWKLVQS